MWTLGICSTLYAIVKGNNAKVEGQKMKMLNESNIL